MKSKKVVVLDVRPETEFNNGHIPGAINIPIEELATRVKKLQKDKEYVAGVNTGRHEAYQHLLNSGFRTELQGVAMERPNEPGYNRAGIYLIDDWR